MKHVSADVQFTADSGSVQVSVPEVADGLWRVYIVVGMSLSNGSVSEPATLIVTNQSLSLQGGFSTQVPAPVGESAEKGAYIGSKLFELGEPLRFNCAIATADPIVDVGATVEFDLFVERIG